METKKQYVNILIKRLGKETEVVRLTMEKFAQMKKQSPIGIFLTNRPTHRRRDGV